MEVLNKAIESYNEQMQGSDKRIKLIPGLWKTAIASIVLSRDRYDEKAKKPEDKISRVLLESNQDQLIFRFLKSDESEIFNIVLDNVEHRGIRKWDITKSNRKKQQRAKVEKRVVVLPDVSEQQEREAQNFIHQERERIFSEIMKNQEPGFEALLFSEELLNAGNQNSDIVLEEWETFIPEEWEAIIPEDLRVDILDVISVTSFINLEEQPCLKIISLTDRLSDSEGNIDMAFPEVAEERKVIFVKNEDGIWRTQQEIDKIEDLEREQEERKQRLKDIESQISSLFSESREKFPDGVLFDYDLYKDKDFELNRIMNKALLDAKYRIHNYSPISMGERLVREKCNFVRMTRTIKNKNIVDIVFAFYYEDIEGQIKPYKQSLVFDRTGKDGKWIRKNGQIIEEDFEFAQNLTIKKDAIPLVKASSIIKDPFYDLSFPAIDSKNSTGVVASSNLKVFIYDKKSGREISNKKDINFDSVQIFVENKNGDPVGAALIEAESFSKLSGLSRKTRRKKEKRGIVAKISEDDRLYLKEIEIDSEKDRYQVLEETMNAIIDFLEKNGRSEIILQNALVSGQQTSNNLVRYLSTNLRVSYRQKVGGFHIRINKNNYQDGAYFLDFSKVETRNYFSAKMKYLYFRRNSNFNFDQRRLNLNFWRFIIDEKEKTLIFVKDGYLAGYAQHDENLHNKVKQSNGTYLQTLVLDKKYENDDNLFLILDELIDTFKDQKLKRIYFDFGDFYISSFANSEVTIENYSSEMLSALNRYCIKKGYFLSDPDLYRKYYIDFYPSNQRDGNKDKRIASSNTGAIDFNVADAGAEEKRDQADFARPQSAKNIIQMIRQGKLDNKEVFIFDYDGTIARDKKAMQPEMVDIFLRAINKGKRVVVLSTGNFGRLKDHLEESVDSRGIKLRDSLTGDKHFWLYEGRGGGAYQVSSSRYRKDSSYAIPFKNKEMIKNFSNILLLIKEKFSIESEEIQLFESEAMVAVRFRLLNKEKIPEILDYLKQQTRDQGLSLPSEFGPFINTSPSVDELNGKENVDNLYHAWFLSTDKGEVIEKRIIPLLCEGDVSKAIYFGDGYNPGESDAEVLKVPNLTKVDVAHHAETMEVVEVLIQSPTIGLESDNSLPASSLDGIASSDIKGGIDFNSESMNVETTGDEIYFNVPLSDQNFNLMNIEGFKPVIINIVPALNVYQLLGLSDPKNQSV